MTKYHKLNAVKGRHKPEDYVALRAWHRVTGSLDFYIEDLQQRAADQGAPIDALFIDNRNGKWQTASALDPKHWFHKELEKFQRELLRSKHKLLKRK